MTYTLRKAVPTDRTWIEALFVEMLQAIHHREDMKGYPAGYLDRFFSGGEDWICVAQVGDTVAAFLSMEVHREDIPYLYLDDFSVGGPYRGQGIGTTLLHRAEEYARSLAIPRLVLHVEASNTGARRLYRRMGFKEDRPEGSRVRMGKVLDL